MITHYQQPHLKKLLKKTFSQYGLMKLKEDQLKDFISNNKKIIINKTCQYTFQRLQEFFNLIKKLSVEDITINNSPQFKLNHISHINLQHLKILNLSGNNILSIQILQIIRINNIQSLILSSNKLSEIKSLRKINPLLNISRIDLSNQTKDLDLNSLRQLQRKNNYQFQFQPQRSCQLNNICQGIQCLYAFQGEIIGETQISSSRLQKRLIAKNIIKKRFRKLI